MLKQRQGRAGCVASERVARLVAMRRRRWLLPSATRVPPVLSMATAYGNLNLAAVPWPSWNPMVLPASVLAELFVTEADFLAATKLVQPTAKREGFAMAPDVSWEDIGALAAVRDELSLSVRPLIFHFRTRAFLVLFGRNFSFVFSRHAPTCACFACNFELPRLTKRMDSPS